MESPEPHPAAADPLRSAARTATISLVVAAAGSALLQRGFDLDTARRLQALGDTPLRAVAFGLTGAGDSLVYLVLTAVAAAAFAAAGRFRPLGAVALFLFLCVAVSGITADLVKVVLARARPTLWFSHGVYGYGFFRIGHDWNSFPSGHATTLGALAAAIAILAPRLRIPAFAIAALLATTRVLIGEHYPSDVLFGFTWGACSSTLLAAWWERRGERLRDFGSAERGVS